MGCSVLSCSILSNATGCNRLQSSDQTYPSSQVSTHMAAAAKASTAMTAAHEQIEQLTLEARHVKHLREQLTQQLQAVSARDVRISALRSELGDSEVKLWKEAAARGEAEAKL